MSAEMRDFAAAFNKGLDRGVGMYEKGQEQAIQREHNKLLRDQPEATARNADRRTDIYADSVKSAAETNRIRAQAALNKGAGKGGGGAAAAPSNANVDMVHQGALAVGLVPPPAPPEPAAPSVTNNYVQQSSDAPATAISPPGDFKKGGMVKAAKGGMIPKLAGGGEIENDAGMSVNQALSYGPKSAAAGTPPPTAAGATGSTFANAYTKSAEAYEKQQAALKEKANAQTGIRPTGPVGTGAGGGYTTADVRPGGALSTPGIDPEYRRGGVVRKFADGGAADMSDPQAAVKAMAYTPADKNPDGSKKTKEQEDEGPIARTASAISTSAPSFGWGSADGATGSGGDSTGGVSGTGGVGGSASDGADGSAATGVGGDDGGTYRRGGRVRRFQSGGRVMEAAIDTGTSGPGSGYGHRAAPPSRRY
jgi:hypothetical protein